MYADVPDDNEDPSYTHLYKDPDADLVIDFDNGHSLRVHSYLLKAHSIFFRDMPPYHAEQFGGSEQRIHLDCEMDHFHWIMLVISKDFELRPYNFMILAVVLSVARQYQFIHILELLRPCIVGCASQPDIAWQMLGSACAGKLPDMAKLVVAALHRHEIGRLPYDEIPYRLLKQLSIQYAVAFTIAVSKHKVEEGSSQEGRWRKIGESFEVKDE